MRTREEIVQDLKDVTDTLACICHSPWEGSEPAPSIYDEYEALSRREQYKTELAACDAAAQPQDAKSP